MNSNYHNITTRRIHPLAKECCLVLTIVLVLLKPGLEGAIQVYVLWLAVLWIFWLIAGLNVRQASTAILIGAILSGILIISQGFLYRSGETSRPLFTLFDINISGRNIGTFTLEGLIAGLVGSLKIFCILISAQMFIATTNIEDFAYSLMKLRIPYTLTFMIITGMRFVPLVKQAWREILDAKQLRGLDIDKLGIIRKITNLYPQSIVPLVLSLFKTGLHLDIAIVTRGFHAKGKRTLYHIIRMQPVDYIALAGLLLIFVLEITFLQL